MNCPSGADGSTTTQLKPDTENFRVRLCSSSVHVPPLLCLLMSGFLPLNNLTPMDPPPRWIKNVTCKDSGQISTQCTYMMRRSGSSWGERRLDGAWMERALFSMSPMFCSACACLACHPPPTPPNTTTTTTTTPPPPTPPLLLRRLVAIICLCKKPQYDSQSNQLAAFPKNCYFWHFGAYLIENMILATRWPLAACETCMRPPLHPIRGQSSMMTALRRQGGREGRQPLLQLIID